MRRAFIPARVVTREERPDAVAEYLAKQQAELYKMARLRAIRLASNGKR
jgi:hypothetical protein